MRGRRVGLGRTVNQEVAGSSPARGANYFVGNRFTPLATLQSTHGATRRQNWIRGGLPIANGDVEYVLQEGELTVHGGVRDGLPWLIRLILRWRRCLQPLYADLLKLGRGDFIKRPSLESRRPHVAVPRFPLPRRNIPSLTW